jgi:hypothetical protein
MQNILRVKDKRNSSAQNNRLTASNDGQVYSNGEKIKGGD